MGLGNAGGVLERDAVFLGGDAVFLGRDAARHVATKKYRVDRGVHASAHMEGKNAPQPL